jgi:hypothetical protein
MLLEKDIVSPLLFIIQQFYKEKNCIHEIFISIYKKTEYIYFSTSKLNLLGTVVLE